MLSYDLNTTPVASPVYQFVAPAPPVPPNFVLSAGAQAQYQYQPIQYQRTIEIPQMHAPPQRLTLCQKLFVLRAIRNRRSLEEDPRRHIAGVLPDGRVVYRKQYETPLRDHRHGRFEVR